MFDGIIVDSRETRNIKTGRQDILDYLKQENVPVESQQLQVGDYWLYDSAEELVLVSRKAADFTDSLYSGHMADELDRCIELIHSYGGGKLFFLLEGPWASSFPNSKKGIGHFKRSGESWFRKQTSSGSSYKVIPGTQISLQTAGLDLLVTNSVHESAMALVSLWERARAGWPTKLTQGISRPELRWHNKNDVEGQKVLRLMALWPHLREEVAFELLRQFGTIGTIIDEVRTEGKPKNLLAIKGVGTTGIENFRSIVC